jgi:carbon-monoxide dehydrogenase medium subunit
MIRTALRHHAPGDLDEAAALLAAHGERAAVVGGGTVLVPSLTRGERDLDHVVDLRRLGLDELSGTDQELRIGASVSYADVLSAPPFPGAAQLLQVAAGGITGGPQIRNQGTVCGSASYANPSSDMPGVLVALGARMHLHGPEGGRTLPAGEFFVDAFRVAARRGELLVAVSVPTRPDRIGYYKFKLAEGSWPIATASAVLPDPDGSLTGATVTLGAVSAVPLRLDLAPLLDGNGDLAVPAAEVDGWVAAQVPEPWDDELAPGDYRRTVAGVVLRRALQRAEENR